jgi:hypothetical protein
MRRRFVLRVAVSFALLAGTAFGASFTWKLEPGRRVLFEGGRPVFAYNEGMQLAPGVPEDRRRCCYVHPLYAPNGVVVTDDFPADHYHHRGLFWAWPVVSVGKETYDLWLMKGIRQESVAVRTEGGVLTAENRWIAGGKAVVREHVRLEALPASGGSRELRVELRLEAVDEPVVLEGSHDAGKSYGGVNVRFAPREGTVIRADGALVAKDEDLVPHTWAELEASYGGKRAALRITSEQGPQQWCLRHYGFVGAAYPGRGGKVTIGRGKSVELRYVVQLR